MTFSEVLKLKMKEQKISAAGLAAKVGASCSYIQMLAAGKLKEPTFTRACLIIDALGLSINEYRALMRQEVGSD